MEKRAEIIIHGRVQKAGFRDLIDEIAFDLDLTGYVKNLEDGTVQVICEGEEDNIKELLEKINIKQYPIRVEKIDVEYKKPTGEFKSFEIIREDDMTTATFERMDMAARYMREMNANLGSKIDGLGDRLENKIDGLGDRLENKIDGLGDRLENKIDGLGDRLENKIDGLGDRLENKIDGLGDRLENKIDGLGDRLENKIDGLGDRLENKIDGLGDRLENKIDQSREEISGELRLLRGDFRSLFDERISRIEHDLAEIKSKIAALQ